jgi:hypothetical protein
MKFDNVETINYVNSLIEGLIFHSTLTDKPEKPFILKYQGLYFKREIRHTDTKVMHLEYMSHFFYKSKDGSFHTIEKPFLRCTIESSFVNKRKEKRKLDIEENQFIDYIIRQLIRVLTLGQGYLDLQGILDGTAEIGMDDKRIPLEIIKEKQDE